MKKKTDFSKLPKKDKKEEKQFSHLARLIKLLIILQQGVLNLDTAAQECGVSRRTILRDIDILEQGGIPLYKPTKQGANYRLLESFKFSKLQITKENALQFADMLDATIKFARTPLNLTTPLQKGVLDLGRTEQQKRKETRSSKNYQFSPEEISEEQFFSAFLHEQHEEKTPPYFTIMMLAKMGKLFDKEERLKLYKGFEDLEYGFLELPKPDFTIFLYVPCNKVPLTNLILSPILYLHFGNTYSLAL